MSDIVERLRNGEPCLDPSGVRCRIMDARYGCLCAIAADEIVRITAEVERLRAALEAALEDGADVSYCDEDECGTYVCCGEASYKPHAPDCWTLKARAALKENNND